MTKLYGRFPAGSGVFGGPARRLAALLYRDPISGSRRDLRGEGGRQVRNATMRRALLAIDETAVR